MFTRSRLKVTSGYSCCGKVFAATVFVQYVELVRKQNTLKTQCPGYCSKIKIISH